MKKRCPGYFSGWHDPSSFLQGMSLAAQWLAEDRIDACFLVGAEETNWITADALRHLDRTAHISAGAGALCLCREPAWSMGVELTAITDAYTYSEKNNRTRAARSMRAQLNGVLNHDDKELLCDGLGDSSRNNAPEMAAWRDWTGPRISPRRILGEGLMAAAAWQCVVACDALANRRFTSANVSLVGFNQQAIGAKFQAHSSCQFKMTQVAEQLPSAPITIAALLVQIRSAQSRHHWRGHRRFSLRLLPANERHPHRNCGSRELPGGLCTAMEARPLYVRWLPALADGFWHARCLISPRYLLPNVAGAWRYRRAQCLRPQ